jgi:hypothetical protein
MVDAVEPVDVVDKTGVGNFWQFTLVQTGQKAQTNKTHQVGYSCALQ